MSANIYWRPVAKKSLNVPAPSSFQEKMEEAGLRLPCTVGREHLDVLRGMSIGFGLERDRPNPFREILELLESYEEIELWAVY